jgi:hypothetical protein
MDADESSAKMSDQERDSNTNLQQKRQQQQGHRRSSSNTSANAPASRGGDGRNRHHRRQGSRNSGGNGASQNKHQSPSKDQQQQQRNAPFNKSPSQQQQQQQHQFSFPQQQQLPSPSHRQQQGQGQEQLWHLQQQQYLVGSGGRRRIRQNCGGSSGSGSASSQHSQQQHQQSSPLLRRRGSMLSASSHASSQGGSSADELEQVNSNSNLNSNKLSAYHRNNSSGSHLSAGSGVSSASDDGSSRGSGTEHGAFKKGRADRGVGAASGGSGSGGNRRLASSNAAARQQMIMMQYRQQHSNQRMISPSGGGNGTGTGSSSTGTPSDQFFFSEPSASESEATMSSFHGRPMRSSPVHMTSSSPQHQHEVPYHSQQQQQQQQQQHPQLMQQQRSHQQQHWIHGPFAPLSPNSMSPAGGRPVITHVPGHGHGPYSPSPSSFSGPTATERQQRHFERQLQLRQELHEQHMYQQQAEIAGGAHAGAAFPGPMPMFNHSLAQHQQHAPPLPPMPDIRPLTSGVGVTNLASPAGGLEAVIEVEEPQTPNFKSGHKKAGHAEKDQEGVMDKAREGDGVNTIEDGIPSPPLPPSASCSPGQETGGDNKDEEDAKDNGGAQFISPVATTGKKRLATADLTFSNEDSGQTSLEEQQQANFNQMLDDMPTPLVGNRKQPLPTKKLNRGHHRRKRSGDAAAANLWLNFRHHQQTTANTNSDASSEGKAGPDDQNQQREWSGMQLDGLAPDWMVHADEDETDDNDKEVDEEDEATTDEDGNKASSKKAIRKTSPKRGKQTDKISRTPAVISNSSNSANQALVNPHGPLLPTDRDYPRGPADKQGGGLTLKPRRSWNTVHGGTGGSGSQDFTPATSEDENAPLLASGGLLPQHQQRSFTNRSYPRMRTSSGESSLASSKDSSIFSWISGKISGLGSSVGETGARGGSKEEGEGEEDADHGDDHTLKTHAEDADVTSSPTEQARARGSSYQSFHSSIASDSDRERADDKHINDEDHDGDDEDEGQERDSSHEHDSDNNEDDEIRSIDENDAKHASETDEEDLRASLIAREGADKLTPLRSPSQRLVSNDSDLQYSPTSSPENVARQVRFISPRDNNNGGTTYLDGSVNPNDDDEARQYRIPTLSIGPTRIAASKEMHQATMRRNLSKGELAQMYDPAKYMIPGDAQDVDEAGHKHNYQIRKCPRCGALQRQFFGVDNAPSQFDSPAGFLALYFGIYVVASFFLFGIEVRSSEAAQ